MAEAPTCAVCCEHESAVFCQHCDDSMCRECSGVVHQGAMSYHRIDPVGGEEPLRCREHPTEFLDFHCEDCHAVVCGRCLLLGVHRGHNCCPLEAWYHEVTTALQAEADSIAIERKMIAAHVSQLQPLLPAIEAACESVDEQLKLEMDGLRGTLVQKEQEFVQEIDEKSELRTSELGEQRKGLLGLIENLTEILDRVQDVTEIEDENRFLMSDPMQLKLLLDETLECQLELTPCVPVELDFVLDVGRHQKAIGLIELEKYQQETEDRHPSDMIADVLTGAVITKPAGMALRFATGVVNRIGGKQSRESSPRDEASTQQLNN